MTERDERSNDPSGAAASRRARAVRLVAFGRPLVDAEVEIPPPGEGEVRVAIRAAGVCHSDAHYRAGESPTLRPPRTLGHEIAGVVEAVGRGVDPSWSGARVALHYNVACGACARCEAGDDMFCADVRMLGSHLDGGHAEAIVVPVRNLVRLPEELDFAPAATLMCAGGTSLHALRRARLAAGETVAVVGVGGLGGLAVQLAAALGASRVFAVDRRRERLDAAARWGAEPIDASALDPAEELRRRCGGVDVALELAGRPETVLAAVRSLGVRGRAALVGLTAGEVGIEPYRDLLAREAEIVGVNDHRIDELRELVALAATGQLDVEGLVGRRIPLRAADVNAALDALDRFEAPGRTVIVPERDAGGAP